MRVKNLMGLVVLNFCGLLSLAFDAQHEIWMYLLPLLLSCLNFNSWVEK